MLLENRICSISEDNMFYFSWVYGGNLLVPIMEWIFP